MRISYFRALARSAAVAMVIAATGLVPAGVASAGVMHANVARIPHVPCCDTGFKNITGTIEASPNLNRRGGPGTNYNIHGTVGYLSDVTIACFDYGNTVTAIWPDGEKYTTGVWDALTDTSTGGANGLYVSDAWVNTGGDTSTMVPECSNVTADPTTYPWGPVGNDAADGHGYLQGQCTSFAAWEVRVDARSYTKSPDWMGDAQYWTGRSSSSMPHVGDVAQWDPGRNGAGSAGHVAIVAAVEYDSGQILIYEYNWINPLQLHIRTISWNAPSRYLQFG
jgi:surface antigen